MPRPLPCVISVSFATCLVLAGMPANAACPVGQVVTVDNDKAGSGYSEDDPSSWEAHNVDACSGTYRYLTRGTSPTQPPGKAFWKPAITVAGVYEVRSGYRGSENRSKTADYVLTGDLGDEIKKVEDQSRPKGQSQCAYVDMGKVRCLPDGKCLLTLIAKGSESVAADITTFTLTECLDVAPPDKPPTGNFDQADANGLSGWTWDPDEPSLVIEAHLYVGGPAGSPGALGIQLTADVDRPDLCASIGFCKHGFLAPFPASLCDNVPRAVHAYGVNTKAGVSAELPGSPKTAVCAPKPVDPPPVGGSPGAAGSGPAGGTTAAGGAPGAAGATGVSGASAAGAPPSPTAGASGKGSAGSGAGAGAAGGPRAGVGGKAGDTAGGAGKASGGATSTAGSGGKTSAGRDREPPVDATGDEGGCATRAGTTTGGAWLLLALLGIGRRWRAR